MFYYISFLRPPPLQATNEPILIVPQISNDLRTEYLEDYIDIYYAWSLQAPSDPSLPVITKPAKLTSWRTSTAYKEIPVPRPPPLDGQRTCKASDQGPSWRLILTCGTRAIDQVVVLGETNTTGKTPFPVLSMPVAFPGRHGLGNKNAGKGKKQERISRSYALHVPLQDSPIVFEITEQISFDLDKKVWDSGIGLSSWLVQLFNAYTGAGADETMSDIHSSLFSTDARHILELGKSDRVTDASVVFFRVDTPIGAGTGIVAITLAILRSTLDLGEQLGSIVITDLPSAMPILQDNISANLPLTKKCAAQAAALDWEHDEISPLVQAQLDVGLDVIVMADVAYNTASFPALIGTLSRLIQLCKQKRDGRPPKVLMGYKERHPDERSLWHHAKSVGLDFRKIAQVDGAGENPIEIWLG